MGASVWWYGGVYGGGVWCMLGCMVEQVEEKWWHGGETTAIKLSGAPGTPLTHCNPEMKVGMGEF